jgi:hypothetical protein
MQDTALDSKVVVFVSILEVTVERSFGFHGRFSDQRSYRTLPLIFCQQCIPISRRIYLNSPNVEAQGRS